MCEIKFLGIIMDRHYNVSCKPHMKKDVPSL